MMDAASKLSALASQNCSFVIRKRGLTAFIACPPSVLRVGILAEFLSSKMRV